MKRRSKSERKQAVRGSALSLVSPIMARREGRCDVPAIGILDSREELVELVTLSGTHDLLSVDVVSNVRQVVVPVVGDVSDSIRGLDTSMLTGQCSSDQL
jgi:hypothetical protein